MNKNKYQDYYDYLSEHVITPNRASENASIAIEGGKIAQISFENKSVKADKTIDLKSSRVFAGFIDIHNHGAAGVDVNTATAADLRKASKFLASKGVTAWLPTFVPDATENYQKVIDAIDEVMQTQDNERSEPAARILGVHYEGVFANEKMCGALRPEFFKTFKNGDELVEMPRLKTPNAIHLTTLAPEIEGGIELIKELKKQNWIISIGHTNANTAILNQALEAGATHVTHLFNAMTGVHHREIGVAGWALTNDKISCEIIADGIHVHPEMLKFAYKNKTAENLALVSDSVKMAGLGDGEYELWNEKVAVINGKTQNERGSIAGSVITMLDAVKMMLSLGISEAEVSKMASLAPAEILGVEKDYGSIETGKRADLVALDGQGNVKMTIVGGKIV
ncbi:MAG: N-acetylglucosamine-6-phosphate deacetylase [Pyrinomonadaceae bacterium]